MLRHLILAYARFLFLPILQLITLASFLAGGSWLWAGVTAYLVVAIAADEIGSDTVLSEQEAHSFFHDFLLYLSVLLIAFEMLMLVWFTSMSDVLSIGLAANIIFGADLYAAREASGVFALVGACLSVGFNLAGAAGGAGHELMHRVNSRMDFLIGQCVLSMSAYSSFMIEHIYGHHRNVGLAQDCGTALRGMSLWRHILRSMHHCHMNAIRYENDRLSRKGQIWFHVRNKTLQGHLVTVAIALLFWIAAGWQGLLAYAVTALVAISVIEAFSYLGHYGLVRVPGTPIEPRHSWNSYSGVLTGLLFNLPRHSSHHASPNHRYWQLERESDAPVMPLGVSSMAVAAMIPPLYFHLVENSLADWDKRLASADERKLIASQGK